MASNEVAIASWSGGTGYAQTHANEVGRNNSAGYIDVAWAVKTRGTWASVSGTWDWNRYGQSGNASGSVPAATGTRTIQSGTTRRYCDANGNYGSFGLGLHIDMYYGQGDSVTHIYPGRSPKAPTIVANIADTVTHNSARLGTEISSHGHGTSSSTRMYYKKPSDGGWTSTAVQGDVGGYNYWTINGLTPNQKYYTLARWWNNNGDTSNLPSPYPNESYKFVTLSQAYTLASTNIEATSATFTGVRVYQGEHATSTKIQYRKQGTTTWTDSEVKTGDNITITLNNLTPSTKYERRFVCTTAAGTTTNSIHLITTLPAAKLVYPNGDVKNAIPRIIYPNGTVEMRKVKIIGGS